MDTFKTLQTEVLSWLDEATNTTATLTNVKNALSMSHQQRCTEQPWTFMRWGEPVTFNLVSGQRNYILHHELHNPIYIKNTTTDRYLVETPQRQIEASGVDWRTDTSGERYRWSGLSMVAVQPSSASTITITSSSASDVGATKGVTITGVTANGTLTETLTPNGVATITSVNSFSRIIKVSKKATWAGTMTLAAGGTTLLTLLPAENARQYPQIELLWTPSATDLIEYDFVRKPIVLTNDEDVPDIPYPYCRILVWDALILMAAYDGDITSARLAAWTDQRDKLETQLQQHYLEGSTIAAEPRYVRDIGNNF